MSVSPLALALIGAIGITAVISLWHNWQQSAEIESLRARHARSRAREDAAPARPVNGRLLGGEMPHRTAPRRPDTQPVPAVSTSPLAPVRHADAMWQASEPYLPELPQRPTGLFARKLPVVRTADAPPWETDTAQQPALDPETEAMRAEYLRSYLAERGDITPETMRDAMGGLRDLPVYGEAPVADVIEAERLTQVMQP